MFIEQLPNWVRRLYPGVKWREDATSKVIYLTFDDGPIPEVTPWVLDVLDRYEIKATFFCVGDNVRKHPEVYQEVLRRGHRVGNHTFNHLRGFEIGCSRYVENVHKASEWIESDLFRPPHGQLRYAQLDALLPEYRIVQWDVISRDYNGKLKPEKVLNIVKRYARNGSIVVFHDSIKAEKNMKFALPKALDYWIKQGFTFRTLE
ncbi:MAG: polysaccharide deacetylase family protein [Bacteroidales bacterium]|nr:polysaccharide deacetylase family protein [Bacteroidales bacterium]MDD4770928.1 polysaccharide deacetylase family protein [Bacteroidales bacterium]HKL92678.1 polysaccharide deacetylase family protein [Bacteroidales bacterium]